MGKGKPIPARRGAALSLRPAVFKQRVCGNDSRAVVFFFHRTVSWFLRVGNSSSQLPPFSHVAGCGIKRPPSLRHAADVLSTANVASTFAKGGFWFRQARCAVRLRTLRG
jgi:hypothetical protein